MLPPNAHWKGFLRFGLIRLRSISSHGTDHASPHGIAQHSQIPILTGSIRQTSARRQYIAQRRTPFPGLATFWERHRADGTQKSLLRNRIANGRFGEEDVRPTANINCLSIQYQHSQPESSQDYCPQLPIKRTLHLPATKHAVSSGLDAAVIFKEALPESFGNQNGLSHPCKDKALNTYGARPETVSIPTRTSSRRVRRKRKLGRPLTRKGLGSKGPVNAPGSIRTLHQFWPLRGSFRAVKVAAAFKDQRRSIHVILRPPRRQIEAVKQPLRVDSTEEHTGDVPPEPPTRPISFATAAELPAKYTDTKDPTFSENSAEIHRQHILTREILTWLRNPEVRNGNNANSLQPCLYKSPPTQLTVMDRVSPTILHRTQREGPSLARPSEAVCTPFLLPSLREPSIYANSTGISIAGLQGAHFFEHPALPESGLRTGDPVKRDITHNHRTTNTSASSPTTPHLSPSTKLSRI
ncbi:hypothetical protein V502_02725 [Pseudogymnoascus sp. VKM F-4520 (FW-2644)]|nr:hypothetical protein V502_02725 [Pseudogymnoascus sp. VKM F-4520 (FW-2644)]